MLAWAAGSCTCRIRLTWHLSSSFIFPGRYRHPWLCRCLHNRASWSWPGCVSHLFRLFFLVDEVKDTERSAELIATETHGSISSVWYPAVAIFFNKHLILIMGQGSNDESFYRAYRRTVRHAGLDCSTSYCHVVSCRLAALRRKRVGSTDQAHFDFE